jgi:hypothetical protein
VNNRVNVTVLAEGRGKSRRYQEMTTRSDPNPAVPKESTVLSESSLDPPTLSGMAASFAAAMAQFVASGFQRVDEQSHQLRVNQCESCRHHKQIRCALCGCFFAIKAWLPHEDCPLGRWES